MSRLFIFAVLLCLSAPTFAQDAPPTVGITATAFFLEDDPDYDLKNEATLMFKSALSKYLLPYDGDIRVIFFLNVKAVEIEGKEQVILSVVEGHSLPPAVIDVAVENETMYSSMAKEDLPEEGKWVREYMTREMLKFYFNFDGYVLEVIDRSELESYITAFVERRVKSMKLI